MTLPESTTYWPEPWLHAYQERVSIMEDSSVPDAEAKAAADVRRQAEDAGQRAFFSDMTPMKRIGKR